MLFIECPHCNCITYIEHINCRIFRHAVYKHTNEPIPPHSPQKVCEMLVEEGRVWGCGKPFKLEPQENGEFVAVVCDYI